MAPITLAALAAFVADAVPGVLHVVGLSLGGMVAQYLAIRYPDRVKSLVVACAGAQTDKQALLARASETEAVGMAGVTSQTLQRWFTPGAIAEERHRGVAYARRRLLTDDPAVFASYWRAMADHDVTGWSGAVDTPATFVAGSRDESVPVSAVKEAAALFPNSETVVVDGPHMLQLENLSSFQQVVLDHLHRVRLGA